MNFIEPKVEILQQGPGLDGLYKHIEICGRTAYKSEDHITKDSAKKFVDMLTNRGHGAALEHGTCYLAIPKEEWDFIVDNHDFNFMDSPYIKYGFDFRKDCSDYVYITTKYRVLMEHSYPELLDYIITPSNDEFLWNDGSYKHFERRISVRFTCDRGVSHEFVRHRVFSFIQESTRYCNYSKDKFGNEITYIIPRWIHDIQENISHTVDSFGESRAWIIGLFGNDLMNCLSCEDRTVSQYIHTLQSIEDCYLDMITQDDGTKLVPQQARQILPNALKTELIMTGTVEQWKGFFKLRCAESAHPDARYLALQLEEMFLNKGYLNN